MTFSCEKLRNSCSFDKKLYQKIAIATFIIGFITHGFCYLNTMYSHDALAAINQNTDFAWKISIGRFMQLANIYLRGPVVLPFVIGVLSLLWLSIAIYFIVVLLGFRTMPAVYVSVAVLTTNTSLTLTNASYIHESDSFMLALLFAVLAVYAFDKFKYGFIASVCCLVVSCGFYQAYLAAAVVLFMLMLLRDILNGMESKAVIQKSAASVATLLAGTALYYIAYKLVLLLFGISAASSYNSLEGAAGFLSFDWGALLLQSYQALAEYLYNPFALNEALILIANAVLVCITLAMLCAVVKANQLSKMNVLLFFLILLLLPQGFAVVSFLSNGVLTDTMMFQYGFLYLLPLLLLVHCKRRCEAVQVLALVMIGVVSFQNYVFANTAYVQKELAYERTLSAVTRVLTEMESLDGYVQGELPVAFVGIFSSDYEIPKLDEIDGAGMSYDYATDRAASLRSYLKYVMAYDLIYLSDEEIADIAQTQVVQEMPSFPDDGYCQVIDGVIVVKLSD